MGPLRGSYQSATPSVYPLPIHYSQIFIVASLIFEHASTTGYVQYFFGTVSDGFDVGYFGDVLRANVLEWRFWQAHI